MSGEPIRAIVTGSQGFIGRALTARLRCDRWDVTEWSVDVRTIARLAAHADVVFHLAAATRAEQFASAPHMAYEVNVAGTLAVLQYCQSVGARCIMASTSGVYGAAPAGRPLSEEAPIHPLTPYSISKWLAECLCRQQAEAFVNAARLAESKGSVFNIGSGRPTRIRDVIQLAETVIGPSCGMDTTGPDAGEPSVVVADITKAQSQLRWMPAYDLFSGLCAMRSHLEAMV